MTILRGMTRHAIPAAAVLTTAFIVVMSLNAPVFAGAEEVSTTDTTELIPDLPPLQQVDGSAGSLLNRDLGTGDQLFCSEIGAEIARIGADWAEAVAANAAALAWEDAEAASVARNLANTLRIAYTNANGANGACLTAANAALTSSPQGSFAP